MELNIHTHQKALIYVWGWLFCLGTDTTGFLEPQDKNKYISCFSIYMRWTDMQIDGNISKQKRPQDCKRDPNHKLSNPDNWILRLFAGAMNPEVHHRSWSIRVSVFDLMRFQLSFAYLPYQGVCQPSLAILQKIKVESDHIYYEERFSSNTLRHW